MSIYGRTEVAWFQLTPQGAARLQTGQYRKLSPGSQDVLETLGKLGGAAEWDELKLYGNNPNISMTALRRLIDLGYVTPARLGEV